MNRFLLFLLICASLLTAIISGFLVTEESEISVQKKNFNRIKETNSFQSGLNGNTTNQDSSSIKILSLSQLDYLANVSFGASEKEILSHKKNLNYEKPIGYLSFQNVYTQYVDDNVFIIYFFRPELFSELDQSIDGLLKNNQNNDNENFGVIEDLLFIKKVLSREDYKLDQINILINNLSRGDLLKRFHEWVQSLNIPDYVKIAKNSETDNKFYMLEWNYNNIFATISLRKIKSDNTNFIDIRLYKANSSEISEYKDLYHISFERRFDELTMANCPEELLSYLSKYLDNN